MHGSIGNHTHYSVQRDTTLLIIFRALQTLQKKKVISVTNVTHAKKIISSAIIDYLIVTNVTHSTKDKLAIYSI